LLARNPSIRRVASQDAARSLTPHLTPGVAAADFFDNRSDFRTNPGAHPTDGFFAAILEKA